MNFPKVSVCADVAALLTHAVCDEHRKQSAAQAAPNGFYMGLIRSFSLIRQMTSKHLNFVPVLFC